MKTNLTKYRGHRFPPEIISHSVWMYHRFCLSLRDVEDLLAKRGVLVTYDTIRRWSEDSDPSTREISNVARDGSGISGISTRSL